MRHVEFLGAEVLVYGQTEAGGTPVILRLDPAAWEAAPSRDSVRTSPRSPAACSPSTRGARGSG